MLLLLLLLLLLPYFLYFCLVALKAKRLPNVTGNHGNSQSVWKKCITIMFCSTVNDHQKLKPFTVHFIWPWNEVKLKNRIQAIRHHINCAFNNIHRILNCYVCSDHISNWSYFRNVINNFFRCCWCWMVGEQNAHECSETNFYEFLKCI